MNEKESKGNDHAKASVNSSLNELDSRTNVGKALGRLLKIIASLFILIGLLVAFPNVQPIVLLLGIIAYFIFQTKKASAVWLIVIALVAVIKLPYFSTGLIVCVGVMCLVGLFHLAAVEKFSSWRFVYVSVLGLSWIFYSVDTHLGQHSSKRVWLKSEQPIACLGDSLTDYGYPQVLDDLIENEILDFGNDGYDTSMALKLVPEILAKKPRVVVIELGGHDYNQGLRRELAEKNLRTMIEQFQAAEIFVILVEIPRGFITDPFFGLERKLARQYDLELIPDTLIRRFVFWSPIVPPGMLVGKKYHLSRDGLHPNEAGNRAFAISVKDALERVTQ